MYELPIRRLRIYDKPKIISHFNNLDDEALASRFGAPVSATYIQSYLSGLFDNAALIFGAFPDSCLRGVGELRVLPDSRMHVAEAAFTVETAWQDRGIGDALLSRIITAAQNRGIREVHMLCLATNQKMRRLAAKHEADLNLVTGQVQATLTAPWPTPLSVAEEISGEYHAMARAILSWPGPDRHPE
ncbi:GNAT family N-acetyltransferase [Ruegeria arenilitoris]|uniref:GNAT family N-acetyltransferase n=1 Tax=Ruegeria arenilitoris TaxID=1173585 RepID=UPI0020C3276A|nr:GNAT family N-acetyltransferase [Ruegeria arenilitoris]